MTEPVWLLIEQPLADYLTASTSTRWTNDGRHSKATSLGIVQRGGGGGDLDLEDEPDVEVTIRAATRAGAWMLARQVREAFAGLNPGGIGEHVYVDECREVFGFRIDPDAGTSDYLVATATYSLVLRPQRQDNDDAPDEAAGGEE